RPSVTTPTARRSRPADDPWSPQEGPGVLETVGRHVEDMAGRLLELRRVVHQQPELSWHELRTTALVTDVLTDAGVRVTPLPGTGAVADLGDPDPRVRVALRADLDALPLDESTGMPFTSRAQGVCHACGHDVHTVGVLGAGLALKA